MAASRQTEGYDSRHPRRLIPELCRQFYSQGWFSGTGGGISIRQLERIYVAPSAVQKERLEPDDLFILNLSGAITHAPEPRKNLSLSQCTPLFMNAYETRNAGAVIHSHGKQIVLASLIYKGSEFKIRRLEMIKGIYHPVEKRMYRYDEELVVPIIENTCFEKDLKESMLEAMNKYPGTNAIIVRRHGIYVWGDTWEQCKTMAECYHYLCDVAVDMHRLGINPYTGQQNKVMGCSVMPVDSSANNTPTSVENGTAGEDHNLIETSPSIPSGISVTA